MTEAADRVPSLRKAHTVYERFRRSGRPVPFEVRLADWRYHAQFRKPRRKPGRLVAQGTSPLVAASIRQARKAAGMTQRDLALVVGVTTAAVAHWERARWVPRPESWVQLELTLGPLGVVRDTGPEPAAREESDAAA